jgi:hypothetical protein
VHIINNNNNYYYYYYYIIENIIHNNKNKKNIRSDPSVTLLQWQCLSYYNGRYVHMMNTNGSHESRLRTRPMAAAAAAVMNAAVLILNSILNIILLVIVQWHRAAGQQLPSVPMEADVYYG